jgi:hypothetical protein
VHGINHALLHNVKIEKRTGRMMQTSKITGRVKKPVREDGASSSMEKAIYICFVMALAPLPLFADGTSQLIVILDKARKAMGTSKFPTVEDRRREREKKTPRKDKG